MLRVLSVSVSVGMGMGVAVRVDVSVLGFRHQEKHIWHEITSLTYPPKTAQNQRCLISPVNSPVEHPLAHR